jgi:hypothetical protein
MAERTSIGRRRETIPERHDAGAARCTHRHLHAVLLTLPLESVSSSPLTGKLTQAELA